MEPIAIIGASCRFPGATNLEEFWTVLSQGKNAISEVPLDRWNVDDFYHPEPATPGKMNTRFGGFLEQIDLFDPGFFGISPREAERIDPQQRLVLEVAYEALENGGIVPTSLSGSSTGVFIGIGNYDYGILLSKDPTNINAYDGTGSTLGVAANRLSYLLNLRGPSLAIETACSSSLVAIHLASRSLQNAETDLCIVGAVSLMLSPEQTITYSQARMMASDGRCKTFDASADGYVRGEGCGIVLLKRLADAVRDGDSIQAIIRGSAINQDGLSNGLTAPNGPSQQAVIRQALENAGVKPAEITYVEAHGTGTSLGDPIEIKSLKSVLLPGRSSEQGCAIGSVKTNIGHLEAAAGMAGLLKVVLALQNQEIPPHLNLKQLNPYISLEGTPLTIPTELQPWTAHTEYRFAGVSSFGFGGTNAHIILQEAPQKEQGSKGAGEQGGKIDSDIRFLDYRNQQKLNAVKSAENNGHFENLKSKISNLKFSDRPLHLLTLSAKSELALQDLALRYESFLGSHSEVVLADVCFTANVGRSHFDYRLAVLSESTTQLKAQLKAFVSGEKPLGLVSRQVTNRKTPKVAFLFTGQGSQYAKMGRELFETQPLFRQILEQCDRILRPYLQQPLLEVLYAIEDSSLLDETAYTQPVLFALEYALCRLWQSWGIEPTVVMGHSLGEYVAACIAGVFSLEDGLKLIAQRGRLMQALPQNGLMVAVMTTAEKVREAIANYPGKIAIAAYNSSTSIVISGEKQAINMVVESLSAEGIKTKVLQISHAFHSPLMEPMLAEFEQVAKNVSYSLPQIKLISNVTGTLVKEEICHAEYWCRHILQPVHFAQGMNTLIEQKCDVLLEIGAKPILLGMGRQCLLPEQGEKLAWLPSLRQGQSDWQTLLSSLAELYVRGGSVDWKRFDSDFLRSKIALPTYPFQKQRYWIERKSPASSEFISLLQQNDLQQLTDQIIGNLSVEEAKVLPKILEFLVKQHQENLGDISISDLLYEIQWQPQSRKTSSNLEIGTWLILADSAGVGEKLANILQERGQSCILVYAGEAYQCKNAKNWVINSNRSEDFLQLLNEVGEIDRIIYLWHPQITTEDLTAEQLEKSQTFSCGSLLLLVQTLQTIATKKPKIWLVTRGAIAITGTVPSVTQTSLWGMGKVIALEYPELFGGMVDLSAEFTTEEIENLSVELTNNEGEDHLALRGKQRFVARLVHRQTSAFSTQLSINSKGTYLITGGLGALGLKVAEWLVKKGAQQLVLIGRKQPTKEAQTIIAQLEKAGAKVFVAQVDVTAQTDLAKLLSEIQATLPPLKGIVHTAGVVGFEALQELKIESLATVMQPKVTGTWLLHQLTQHLKLDFFVLFSSIASVWGSKGQAHYAAANAFLDGFAHYRRSLGMPAISINWGPWAGGGMTNAEAQNLLNLMGITALSPQKAIAALAYLLKNNPVQATVADVEWGKFKQLYELRGQRLLLENLQGKTVDQNNVLVPSSQSPVPILQELEMASKSDRLSLIVTYLQSEIAQILKCDANQVPSDKGFFEMGMDSLMSIELKTKLEKIFGISLPPTVAFEYPNISELAKYLTQQIKSENSANQYNDAVSQDISQQYINVGEIEQLSESAIDSAIAQELMELEQLLQRN